MRKKLFLWSRKTFEIESEGQEFAKTLQSLEQFVRTVKGQKNACSWRFLRFDRTIRIQISKNYLDSDTCRKSLKNNFSFLFEVQQQVYCPYFAKKNQAKKGFQKNWHSKETILSHILPVFYSSATTSSSGFIALQCKITPSENQNTITMWANIF